MAIAVKICSSPIYKALFTNMKAKPEAYGLISSSGTYSITGFGAVHP
jgi:hypothetical protein